MGNSQPLAGLRVLDLSRVLAGPWCTQMLADFGAEVIKVEKPGTGDDSRGWGPPYYSGSNGKRVSAYFCATNRGKRSLEVDFEDQRQLDKLKSLATECDVLVENFRVDTLKRYGLDFPSLSKVNPRLVYCSITGFGQTGPIASRPGYDTIMQGMGGLMSVTGPPDSQPEAGPTKVGVPLTDIMTGVYAANGILLALRQRDLSGLGQHIDLALLDVQVSSLSVIAANYLASGKVPGRNGNGLSNAAPSDAIRCKDGFVMIMVATNPQFRKLCMCLGLQEVADDPRYATNEDRVISKDSLMAELRPVFLTRERKEWIELLSAHGVPCGPINDFREVFDDPQVQSRENLLRMSDADFGEIRVLANPIRLSRTPAQYRPIPTVIGSAEPTPFQWSQQAPPRSESERATQS